MLLVPIGFGILIGNVPFNAEAGLEIGIYVTMSVKALLAVLARRVVTPHSRRRLPKNSMPSRGRPDGTTKQVRSIPTMGNMIFSFCDTARAGDIVTILLGMTVGASTQASQFLTPQTIFIFFLGFMAFIIASSSGVL